MSGNWWYDNLYVEHIIFATAVAVLVGMLLVRNGYNDYSWIIILLSFLPDVDHFNDILMVLGIVPIGQITLHWLIMGMLHTVGALVIVTVVVALIFQKILDMKFKIAVILVSITYTLHLFCDWISLRPNFLFDPPLYMFLYPLSNVAYGIAIIPETGDLFIADSKILIMSVIILAGSIVVRMRYEPDWAIGIEIKKRFKVLSTS